MGNFESELCPDGWTGTPERIRRPFEKVRIRGGVSACLSRFSRPSRLMSHPDGATPPTPPGHPALPPTRVQRGGTSPSRPERRMRAKERRSRRIGFGKRSPVEVVPSDRSEGPFFLRSWLPRRREAEGHRMAQRSILMLPNRDSQGHRPGERNGN